MIEGSECVKCQCESQENVVCARMLYKAKDVLVNVGFLSQH